MQPLANQAPTAAHFSKIEFANLMEDHVLFVQ